MLISSCALSLAQCHMCNCNNWAEHHEMTEQIKQNVQQAFQPAMASKRQAVASTYCRLHCFWLSGDLLPDILASSMPSAPKLSMSFVS